MTVVTLNGRLMALLCRGHIRSASFGGAYFRKNSGKRGQSEEATHHTLIISKQSDHLLLVNIS